jgi:hypothetical protein
MSRHPDRLPCAITFWSNDDLEPWLRGFAAIFPACAKAVQSVVAELNVTMEEQRRTLAGSGAEAEQHAPQIVTVLCLLALLPVIEARAFKHFRHKRRESHHDAEELSQATALKVLKSLTGNWPRGNVGAWLKAVRDNVHRDHLRKRGRQARGYERLEEALKALRR